MSAEASRAKHKFAVKRNSWPKTRGVAMNPVDHVRFYPMPEFAPCSLTPCVFSLTEVVTINISVKHQPFHGTRHKVKKQVSSQLEELVCYVVRRRRRIRFSGVLIEKHTEECIFSLQSIILSTTMSSLFSTECLCS